jgi:hypothetical protein
VELQAIVLDDVLMVRRLIDEAQRYSFLLVEEHLQLMLLMIMIMLIPYH